MKILNRFTLQSLKLNKKRTIVTVIGIVLSTSLICGVVGLVSSFQKTFINMVKESVGNYHTKFYDVPEEEIAGIQNNANIELSFLIKRIGFAYLTESKNNNKPYLMIYGYDENALKNNGIKLLDGRLPQNNNELLISAHIKDNARVNYKIGDTVTLNIGNRVSDTGNEIANNVSYNPEEGKENIIDTTLKTYTIVGLMERPDYSMEAVYAPGYTVVTMIDNNIERADVAVLYKEPKSCVENNKIINNKKYEQFVNSELLRYQGVVSNDTMNALLGIAIVTMVIIVFSSVFVIRNSFSISVAEKNKQYGMLSSIGATKKQIKRSVIFEGFIIGAIAVPLGIICGVVGIIILLQIVNYLLAEALNGMKFVYDLPFIPMLITVLISFLTIYLSCLIPARRASRISPIEAIRGNNDIKIKAKKLKTPKYIYKLFGIGGVIADKNLKRNRKKYITTVISIVVSIVIFISLSSFIYYGNKVSNVYYTEINYNIALYDKEKNVELYKDISKLPNVDDFSYCYNGTAAINTDKYYSDFGKEMIETYSEDEPLISVAIYNNEYFKKYLKDLGINEGFYDKGAILIDDFIVNKTDGGKISENIYNINSGDIVDVTLDGSNKEQTKILRKTEKRPMGRETNYYNSGLLVLSEDYFNSLEDYSLDWMYINSENSTEVENKINDLSETDEKYFGIVVDNFDKYVEIQNRMVLVISIFLYGFISVITLIGVTNIFNTITTNMILRSKEFAMLKSIGMTNKEFSRMIRLESILYGLKSLFIGIPLGLLGSYAMYVSYAESVDMGYRVPIESIGISIVFVFIIIGITMKYSLNKINKQNIIDTIRNDNI